MDLSINGHCKVPPGFRFHPTEEELLQYYLKNKVAQEMIDLDVIPCVDLNKLEPWDIQEKCKIGSAPQSEWYFFSRKDKKYPSGARTNRATEVGFWKATGRDKIVYSNSKRIGLRKTLVFYLGRAPSGKTSDWIMYEYRLEDNPEGVNNVYNFEPKAEDWWVICRLFKKRNFMAKESPQKSSISSNSMDKIKNNKQENNTKNDNEKTINHNDYIKLQPSINTSSTFDNEQDQHFEVFGYTVNGTQHLHTGFDYPNSNNHSTYQENESIEDLEFSQIIPDLQMPYLFPSTPYQVSDVYNNDMDLWGLLDQI